MFWAFFAFVFGTFIIGWLVGDSIILAILCIIGWLLFLGAFLGYVQRSRTKGSGGEDLSQD